MSRGSVKFAAGVVALLAVALVLWLALRPVAPVVPTSDYQADGASRYEPGSPFCFPSRLNGLSGAAAADEKYRCDVAAAEKQARGEGLVQQTRSAEADVAMVALTYRQTLVALASALIALLTLAAAFSAAWYAKLAAAASEQGVVHAANVAHTELRPWLTLTLDSDWASNGKEDLIISFVVRLKNIGRTPAQNVRVAMKYMYVPFVQTDEHGRFASFAATSEEFENWSPILPSDEVSGQKLLFFKWSDGMGPTNADGETPSKALKPVVAVIVEYRIDKDQIGRTAASFWVGMPKPSDPKYLDPIWSHGPSTITEIKAIRGLQSEIL